jgi:hypothetical protein
MPVGRKTLMPLPRLFTFYQELSLAEGFQLLLGHKHARTFAGTGVSLPAAKSLFIHAHLNDTPLRCWNCQALAGRFVLAREDSKKPKLCLKLLAEISGNLVELTRDHIVPKSFNGSNAIENLRVSCAPCNNHRHNHLSSADLEFMQSHPELYARENPYGRGAKRSDVLPFSALLPCIGRERPRRDFRVGSRNPLR